MAGAPRTSAWARQGFENKTAGLPAGASLPGFQSRDVSGLGDEASVE
jgi:hypothetical protein